ncbi:MAG: glycosyltransferase family 4 protein, partial [Saprospiraceae bacterium]|nr:glycosyltransferase family 4 protein [Saprospiraceae bacterium]
LTIIFVGRIGTYQKNIELLLDVISDIESLINVEVLILGHITKEFQNKLDSKTIIAPKSVRFYGEVSSIAQISELYSSADILVMTSRFEGFPLCAVEALYSGCYLVVNNNCGVTEIIENNYNGIVYESKHDLSQIIVNFSKNSRTEINKLKNNARSSSKDIVWSKTIPKLRSVIESRINE